MGRKVLPSEQVADDVPALFLRGNLPQPVEELLTAAPDRRWTGAHRSRPRSWPDHDDTRLVARVHTPMRMSIRFRTSVERVIVPAVVTDRDGRCLAGLPVERFVVLEDGTPQEISCFEAPADRSQLDLAVAIDISGSMAPLMPGLKTSVKALLASLRPDDMVTLPAFRQSRLPGSLAVTSGVSSPTRARECSRSPSPVLAKGLISTSWREGVGRAG